MLMLAFTVATHAATNDLTTLLQKGLFEEEANRNLDAAISNYQSLANDFDKDRQLAATAIFRLGECYRKLGRTNEAVAQYQRIVREFSDQQTLATLSQQNLTGLGAVQNPSQAEPSVRNQLERQNLQTDLTNEKANYDQEQTLLDTLRKMSREKLRKALPTLVPDNQFNNLLSELDLAQQNLLKLKADYAESAPKYISAKELVDDLNRKIDDRIYGILTGLQARLDASNAHIQWLEERIAEQSGGTQTASEQPPITDEEEKEIRRIQAMIQNSPDLINAPSGDPRMTPLRRAAGLGQLRVAKFLLEAKADVNQMDDGQSPLYYAALNGQRAMVQLLLANGADVNAKGNFGYTALSVAAEHGFVSVAETLLTAKADVNTQDSRENTPLIRAVRGGHLAVAELLLAHGADPNLAAAGRWNYNSPPSESDAGAPLHFAVLKGDKPMVSLLMSNHADIELRNPYSKTPLEIAAEGGRTDIARLLLDAGANPNPEPADSKVDPPLLLAAWRGDTNMVSLFLSKGAEPNYVCHSGGDTTALMAAVLNDHPETATILLQNRADPNLKGIVSGPFNGSTAFWYGFGTSGAKCLIPLLEYGADPNQTDNYHEFSPLMGVASSDQFSSATDRVAVARLLIEKGANVNAKDNEGQTALHVAVLHNRPEMVELLLANKADVNVADKQGRTPLNIATGSQSPQTPGPLMTIPPPRPFRTPPGTQPFEGNNSNPSSPKIDMVALLREHGALDELPDFNSIRVTRGSAAPTVVFEQQSNGWNQVSLFDVLGVQYKLLTASPGGVARTFHGWGLDDLAQPYASTQWNNSLPFPDLARVVIHRPAANGAPRKDLKIDVAKALDSGDCIADVPLQFGDVVEIPEADHVMNSPWKGLATNELFNLKNCITRHLEVTVKGETTNLTLAPEIRVGPDRTFDPGEAPRASIRLNENQPYMLWAALRDSKLLLASSDLSRIKVKRHDAKSHEWTVDCSNPNSPPNFWLRDGDVIEVPEKPE